MGCETGPHSSTSVNTLENREDVLRAISTQQGRVCNAPPLLPIADQFGSPKSPPAVACDPENRTQATLGGGMLLQYLYLPFCSLIPPHFLHSPPPRPGSALRPWSSHEHLPRWERCCSSYFIRPCRFGYVLRTVILCVAVASPALTGSTNNNTPDQSAFSTRKQKQRLERVPSFLRGGGGSRFDLLPFPLEVRNALRCVFHAEVFKVLSSSLLTIVRARSRHGSTVDSLFCLPAPVCRTSVTLEHGTPMKRNTSQHPSCNLKQASPSWGGRL